MKLFESIEQADQRAILAFAKEHKPDMKTAKTHSHPQEDYLLVSKIFPIFAVADGVTLSFKKFIGTNEPYPSPSPSGDVARIFCEIVIAEAEKRYEDFSEEDIKETFVAANNAVKEFNQQYGKSDISGNSTGFFSATGAFAVLKDSKVYFLTICDSQIRSFNNAARTMFRSGYSYRPYGVVNGEEKMVKFTNTGYFDVKDGYFFAVFTDGFEDYFERKEFIQFFKDWNGNLTEKVKQFSKKMIGKDPVKFGLERSLIMIKVGAEQTTV